MASFPPALPHGAFIEVFPDVFVVSGETRPEMMGASFQFSRNMIVVREPGGLTLVNTLRLDDAGLEALGALGTPQHIVRLGAFHGRDDAFYRDRYRATLWSLPGVADEHGASVDRELVEGGPLPIGDASLFVFASAKLPEAVLRLERHGGILVTCDSLQNWVEPDAFFDAASTERMTAAGFFREANVGPGWAGAAEPQAEDFARLRELPFAHLLPGHGRPLLDQAHAKLTARFAELGL